MCPEPALLVAYLDGTLFSRDAIVVEEHVASCERCSATLAAMRRERETAAPSKRLTWTGGAAALVLVIVGFGVWVVLPRSKTVAPPAAAPVRSEAERVTEAPAAAIASAPAPAPAAVEAPRAARVEKPRLRAVERTPPRVQWRAGDHVVERSIDGGVTWTLEHTADRSIRASAFVDAEVAWLVGERGLVLRRTRNGWFGASPPADGTLTAVRASSPSKATVTLEDGRVFSTGNGGVTWLPAAPLP